MSHLNVAVIGHVDHGKTSLVRALTGMETDRLPEEKARGMSIVPGFAWLETPAGTVDLVDLPGHEDFMRAMIAGTSGASAALLVVDALEGIMPQTREHLAVARLLGIARGLVAISKVDRATAGQCERLKRHIFTLFAPAGLADEDVVATSARSGEGMAALRAALERLQRQAPPPPSGGASYVPVDRVFSLPGHGTVVTGTLRGAPLRAGSELSLGDGRPRVQVRRLEVHGRPRELAHPGERVGVNLRGLGRKDVRRGDVLAAPGALAPLERFVAEVELLESVGAGAEVRLSCGTLETVARLGTPITAGIPGRHYAALRCRRAVLAPMGERFVLRTVAGDRTVGGGRILASGNTGRRALRALAERLPVGTASRLDATLVAALSAAGDAGVEIAQLARLHAQSEVEVLRRLRALPDARLGGACAWHRAPFEIHVALIRTALATLHSRHPLRDGATLGQLRAALPAPAPQRLVEACLRALAADGIVHETRSMWRLATHDPLARCSPRERSLAAEMEAAFHRARWLPPDPPRQREHAAAHAVYRLLVARGALTEIGTHEGAPVAMHREALRTAREALAQAFPPPATFTVSEARQLLVSTRKFVVPLLEFLDLERYTRRVGDRRTLLCPANGGE